MRLPVHKSACLRILNSLLLLTLTSTLTSLPVITHPQQPGGTEHQFQEIAPGVEYLQLIRNHAAKEEGAGPWVINVLRIDLKKAKLKFVHALDEAVGLETVSSLAQRYAAVAATNGGYFRTTGTFRGDSMGAFMLNRKLMSEPNDRSSIGLSADGAALVFGRLKFFGRVSSGANSQVVAGINRPVGADELVIFTPAFHRTTLTSPDGVEAVVRKGRVIVVHDKTGSTLIPEDGYVISAAGTSRTWVLKHCRRGKILNLSLNFDPISTEQSYGWSRADSITAGGPQLIKDGRVAITNDAEKIAAAFVSDRHPRTTIAKLSSGHVLLLTVDGRQPAISVGMSLHGLAELLLEFGAKEAVNLDGGGSTTMVVRNKIVNHPSDQTGERPVSDAILIYSRRQ